VGVRANLKWKLVTQVMGSLLVLMLTIGITSCEQSTPTTPKQTVDIEIVNPLATTDGPLSEVNIPQSIAQLAPNLANFQPQVKIISPQVNQVLTDDRVNVKLQVSDLPIFKSPELGLGNHLHVILDKQTYQGVYDLTQPLVFKNLAAGTHTLRVFASRPWHESFKNSGAYAQVTFHVLTKTAENNPDPQQPLLTYSRPTGIYGAEPIMLDYYLTNAPSHAITNGTSDRIPDWKIRATVNNQQFTIDRWTPIYLQGFKPGKNWVRLELVGDRGQPIPNVYNDTISIITYDPQASDSLTKLIRGEIDPNLAQTLVDPNYVAVKPIPVASPGIVTAPPIVKPTPNPIVSAPSQPTAIPQPLALSPQPIVKPIPSPVLSPATTPSPIVVAPTQPLIIPSPVVTAPSQSMAPSPVPVQIPTPTALVQPPIQPKMIPAPVPVPTSSNPAPIAAPRPVPVQIQIPAPTPVPNISQNPAISSPQPLMESPRTAIPQPNNAPCVEPATSIKRLPSPTTTPTPQITPPAQVASPPSNNTPVRAIDPSSQLQPQNPTPIAAAPVTATPQEQEQQTWKTQAIELIKFAGVKIRAFTNTIPGKAQRFGHNMQILTGKAIKTIRSWQN
jgi:hypothetical protein